jgi:hypothetical protein
MLIAFMNIMEHFIFLMDFYFLKKMSQLSLFFCLSYNLELQLEQKFVLFLLK